MQASLRLMCAASAAAPVISPHRASAFLCPTVMRRSRSRRRGLLLQRWRRRHMSQSWCMTAHRIMTTPRRAAVALGTGVRVIEDTISLLLLFFCLMKSYMCRVTALYGQRVRTVIRCAYGARGSGAGGASAALRPRRTGWVRR